MGPSHALLAPASRAREGDEEGERGVFDTSDRAVEHLVAVYPPDRYTYSVSLGV